MSRPLFERLRSQRRETRPLSETQRALLARTPGAQQAMRQAAGAEARVPTALGDPVDLQERSNERGRYTERTAQLASSHRHGTWTLSEVDAVPAEVLVCLTGDPALAQLDLRRAVFLDIETTGLSGGSGTVPFLVALGRFVEGGFELWQGFARDPDEEAAVLAATAERIEAADALVSFFGKSFDRHRLEDKMRHHVIAPPFEQKPHLDLYHPLARLYRGALPDGRLATTEASLCGVVRKDDLPGSYAPAAWFDYLAGRPHRLEAVFEHNAIDVLSLVVLAAHVGCALRETRADGSPLEGPSLERARALARLFATRRQHAETLRWVERAQSRSGHETWQRELKVLRADALRLSGSIEPAVAAYLDLEDGTRDAYGLHAALQLAKLAEHRLRDRDRARRHLTRARALAEELPPQAVGRAVRRDLLRREARLFATADPAPEGDAPGGPSRSV